MIFSGFKSRNNVSIVAQVFVQTKNCNYLQHVRSQGYAKLNYGDKVNTSKGEIKKKDYENKVYGNSRDKKSLIVSQKARNEELEEKAKAMGLGWRLVASTILHRYPVILREMEPWEQDFANLQNKIDEIKKKEIMEELKGTKADILGDMNPTYDEILKTLPFEPAPRITEDDLSNNRRSQNRKLDSSLYLIVKRNRDENSWQFPQGKIQPEESLRQACERVIDRAIGKTDRWFIANSPIAHYCYEYPKEVQEQRKEFGAKVFYIKIQLIAGQLKLEKRLYTDFAWMARDEIDDYFGSDQSELVEGMLPLY